MPRPLVDTAALRANLQAAMASEPDDKTVFQQERKRKIEGNPNDISPKRFKFDEAAQSENGRIERILNDISPERFELDEAAQNENGRVERILNDISPERFGLDKAAQNENAKTENDLEPDLNTTPHHTASLLPTADTSGWSGGDLTLAIYGDGKNEDITDDSPHHESTNPTVKHEVETDDERRIESDALLVEAYSDMGAAAEDMALGARKTAEALVAKIAASKREVEAAAETLRAQERYELAMARIGRAVAHRSAVRVEVSDGEESG